MKCNMFESTAASILDLYGEHITGAPTSTLLVVSFDELPGLAKTALENSATTLSFGTAPLAFARIVTPAHQLGAEDIHTLVEGIDPVALVVTDAAAALLFSAAYHIPLVPDASNRAQGRTCIVFQDFAALLSTPSDKQRAWGLLKQLRLR